MRKIEMPKQAQKQYEQLNKRFKIIKEGNTVVDLGAAPGGWSQVALEKIGEEGVVVGVDLNRIKPFPEGNFYGIRGDFTKDIVQEKVMELMEACDTWIPLPPRDIDKPFLMPVEDVFSITGRGTVATGRIETGVIHVGDEVEILGLGENKKSVVTGVEMFRKLLDEGQAGDNVGLLLRGIDKNEIKRGMVLCKPGQIKPHSTFKASIYVLKKEEGGRHTPFHNKYRPQFYLRTMDCTGEISLSEGVEMVMPGDNVEIKVELIYPVALNVGLRFAIREGGRTVGSGQITELLD